MQNLLLKALRKWGNRVLIHVEKRSYCKKRLQISWLLFEIQQSAPIGIIIEEKNILTNFLQFITIRFSYVTFYTRLK